MRKGLVLTGALIAVTAVACAWAHADEIHDELFAETKLIEYRTEVHQGDTLWDICSEIATDKEDLNRLVWQAMHDNRIEDPAELQPGMLVIIRVKEARK